MTIQARYKGNSETNYQLTDSSENGNNLVKNGPINSERINKSFSKNVPTPPITSNAWLAGFDTTNNGETTGGRFIFPIESRPHNDKGFISVWINFSAINRDLNFDYYYLVTDDGSNSSWFDVYPWVDGDAKQVEIYYTDSSFNYLDFFVSDGEKLFDGNNHNLVFSWDGNLLKVYIDDVEKQFLDINTLEVVSAASPYFGDESFGNISSSEISNGDVYTNGAYVLLGDMIVSANEYNPNGSQDETVYIAHWKGQKNKQLLDSTGNGNDLEMDGVVYNPPEVLKKPLSESNLPTPPNGNTKWLGAWDYTNNTYFPEFDDDASFLIPLTARPQNAAGFVSSYVNISNDVTELDNDIFWLRTYSSDENSEREFDIYNSVDLEVNDSLTKYINLYFTDSNNDGYSLVFDNSSSVFDGNTHKILVSWDGISTKAYIDDVEVDLLDWNNNLNVIVPPSPDFGTGQIIEKNIIDGDCDNDGYVLVDDITVSSISYVPNTIQNSEAFIARWKGNSNRETRLVDLTGNENNLIEIGEVYSVPEINTNQSAYPSSNSWMNFSPEFNGYLSMPLSTRPQNDGGSISFYMKTDSSTSFTGFYFYVFETDSRDGDFDSFSDDADDRWFYIYDRSGVLTVNPSDKVRDNNNVSFNTDVYDDNTHFIEVNWKTENGKTKVNMLVDGILDNYFILNAGIDFGNANKPYGEDSSWVSLGRNASGLSNNLYMADVKVKDANGDLIAYWKGNDGQLEDASGNENTLIKEDGEVYKNPSDNKAPEGNRWLASFQGGLNGQSNGNSNNKLIIPLSSRPHSDKGRISVWFKCNPVNFTDEEYYSDGISFDTSSNGDSADFYIYPNDILNKDFRFSYVSANYVGSNNITLNSSETLYDGKPHHIWITWNNNLSSYGLIKVYVDGILDTAIGDNFDMGDDSYESINETSIGGYIAINQNAFFAFDDLVFSALDESPDDEIDESNVIARWRGEA